MPPSNYHLHQSHHKHQLHFIYIIWNQLGLSLWLCVLIKSTVCKYIIWNFGIFGIDVIIIRSKSKIGINVYGSKPEHFVLCNANLSYALVLRTSPGRKYDAKMATCIPSNGATIYFTSIMLLHMQNMRQKPSLYKYLKSTCLQWPNYS